VRVGERERELFVGGWGKIGGGEKRHYVRPVSAKIFFEEEREREKSVSS